MRFPKYIILPILSKVCQVKRPINIIIIQVSIVSIDTWIILPIQKTNEQITSCVAIKTNTTSCQRAVSKTRGSQFHIC